MVSEGWSEQRLRDEGYEEGHIDFALSQRQKSKEQLEKDGWDIVAFDFLVKYAWPEETRDVDFADPNTLATHQQLEDAGLLPIEISILQSHQALLTETWAEMQPWYSGETSELPPHQSPNFRLHLKRKGLPAETLAYFAGPLNSLRTERDLRREGLEISSMGVTIPNQPYNPPPTSPALADPSELETEGLVTQANRASRRLWLGMKYWDGLPVLRKARMISKPTKRFYLSAKEIGDLCRGRGAAKNQVKPLSQVGEILAVVTEKGVLEARECVDRGLGGLVLCRIW